MPVGVRIDVGGDLDPGRARLVEPTEQAAGLPVQAAQGQLEVGDLDRQGGLAADRQDLVDRLPEVAVLAADVADVAAAAGGGHAGQRDHLVGGRVDPRVVLETRAQAEGAGIHLPRQQLAHALDFRL